MLKNTKLRLNMLDKPITVDLDQYTADRVDQLTEKVAAIRIKYSIYAKYPQEAGETREAWAERVSKLAQDEYMRKDDETVQDHLKRMFDPKTDTHKMAFEITNAICEVFGQDVVSEARYKSASWLALKNFIYDVLSLGDIPCSDFLVEDLKR